MWSLFFFFVLVLLQFVGTDSASRRRSGREVKGERERVKGMDSILLVLSVYCVTEAA